jgi:hypothetical protein
MLKADVDAFLAAHGVKEMDDGDILLTRDDALILLVSLLETAGPMPAYVDVYSRTADGELKFEEDLTTRDLEDSGFNRRQYWTNILAYLNTLSSCTSGSIQESRPGQHLRCWPSC